jgi:hypothetical protein
LHRYAWKGSYIAMITSNASALLLQKWYFCIYLNQSKKSQFSAEAGQKHCLLFAFKLRCKLVYLIFKGK